MNIETLYKKLISAGTHFDLVDAEVKVKLPKQLDPELKQQLIEFRDELKAYVTKIFSYSQQALQVIPKQELGDEIPLSYAQARTWLVDAMQGSSVEYNIPIALHVEGSIDTERVEMALREITLRHQVLRTNYVDDNGAQYQVIRAPEDSKIHLHRHDVSELDVSQRSEAIAKIVESETQYVFDLSKDLMLRASYIKEHDSAGILTFVMHHIASDGWSVEILKQEFIALYQEKSLEALTVQYADYAVWHRDLIDKKGLDEQLAFWQAQLSDAPPLHGIATKGTRPERKMHVGSLAKAHVSPDIAVNLDVLTKRLGITQFMLIHAVLSLVLARHSSRSDVIIGTPVANRDVAGIDKLIGYFANTVVYRVETNQQNILAFFEHVKQVHHSVQKNKDVPFEMIVESLNIARQPSYSPIFQVLLTTSNEFSAVAGSEHHLKDMAELSLTQYDSGFNQVKFDLEFDIAVNQAGIDIQCLFDEALFEYSYVHSICEHIGNVFNQLGNSQIGLPERLSDICVLSDNEIRQQLELANIQQCDVTADKCLHELVEQQSLLTPNCTALRVGDDSVSYQELNDKASQLANYLIEEHKVTTDSVVAIYATRSFDMITMLLAVLKAGGAYLPLEPSYPAARLNYLLESAQSQLILSSEGLVDEALNFSGKIIELRGYTKSQNAAGFACAGYSKQMPSEHGIGRNTDSLAYVIHTSGSTGNPKGVMIEHRSVVNRIKWMMDNFPINDADRVLHKTPFNFDVSVWEIFWPLAMGAELVISKPEGHKDPEYLCNMLNEHKITQCHFVPSVLSAVMDVDGFSSITSLKAVFCSGEALRDTQAQQFSFLLPNCQLHNLYGPTEASIEVSHKHCVGHSSQIVSLGKPISNVQLIILDEQLNMVPQGVSGELMIGGIALARGYIGQPELTNERFIRDVKVGRGSTSHVFERLYRSGDIVRLDEHGNLHYLGRADDQVKLRGIRIELGEIESQLEASEFVSACHASVVSMGGSDKLVAYVKTEQLDASSFEAVIRNHALSVLPEAMCPDIFVYVDIWPTTNIGKLDKSKLPSLNLLTQITPEFKPSGEMELLLAETWSTILNIPVASIGKNSNFFSIGGHSLLLLPLRKALAEKQLQISVADIYRASSLSQMADALTQAKEQSEDEIFSDMHRREQSVTPNMVKGVELSQTELNHVIESVPGGVDNIHDIYPLAPLQQGVLFMHKQMADTDPYVMNMLIACSDPATQLLLQQCIQKVIDRHEALRTGVLWRGLNEAVQVVYKQAALPVSHTTISESKDYESAVLDYCRNGKHFIDVERAPLVHLEFIQNNQGQTTHAIVKNHHLVSDHISLEIIMNDVLRLADGKSLDNTQVKPYRHFVRHALSMHNEDKINAFFSEQLADVTEPSLPYRLTNTAADGSSQSRLTRTFDAEQSDKIRQLMANKGMSVAAFFHTAWAMVIAQLTDAKDVVFGSVFSGRLGVGHGCENTVGMLINTLPVRVKLHSAMDTLDIVANTLNKTLEVEQASLAHAQKASGISNDLPLFNACLNYRHEVRLNSTTHNSAFEVVDASEKTSYPIALSVSDFGLKDVINFEYHLEQPYHIQHFCEYMEHAIEALIKAVEQQDATPLYEYSLLGKSELEQQVIEFNGKAVPFDDTQRLFDLVDAHARTNPNSIAIEFQNTSLTYSQLKVKSDQIAKRLLQRCAPDSQALIGICQNRSSDMIVTMLGILKAGCAYVPLDPQYPIARLQSIVEESGVSCVVCHQDTKQLLASTGVQQLEYDTLQGASSPQHDSLDDTLLIERQSTVAASDLAYVIFTSGSTGQPKGVMIEHRGMVNLAHNQQRKLQVVPSSVVLQFASISFDAASWEWVMALTSGARLVIADKEQRLDPSALMDLMLHKEVTHATLPPAMLLNCKPIKGLSLTALVVAGEACDPEVARVWGANYPLFNAYGPSENSVCTTLGKIQPSEPVNIGYPIDNNCILVLNCVGNVAPLGTIGELYIGGDGLARCYMNLEQVNQERFVKNPHYHQSQPPSYKRLYRTGDLVKFNNNGTLEFIGRVDEQVKLRGFRIELSEIEAHLNKVEGVEKSVVQLLSQNNNHFLVGYILGDKKINQQELIERARLHVSKHLPDFMRPSVIQFVDELPLTINGKINKAALPEVDFAQAMAASIVPLETKTQHQLADIWVSLLGDVHVGKESNFFDLGGHSLLVSKLSSAIKAHWNVEVPIATLYENHMLVDMATQIDNELLLINLVNNNQNEAVQWEI
ncbi:non-ribosomal peptide synthetase [Pseudoalteromonas luteoviolacea]|uniref:Carrier domain-containing protein n=1 Tax=Pseudoalteromonas luteoviolacea S4060-1 TaxID=1365257 RepID=A0A167J3H2_9GAMM|nr:non-ribosomal peptide synthetase [Pseudoalteromonas luteoviolacea]KZN60467.1 hypothetical protein N478_26190 [Pseudoalteromonas luteoviolacea S4060-1]